tara:strand:- start:100584 stop:100868 length:285 start_codon:yes stop_codon:yes gene_type:complete
MVQIEVKITQEHIDDGYAGSCVRCPIALCLIEMGFNNVYVSDKVIKIDNEGGESILHKVPRAADLFIYDFDHCNEVEPFVFEISDFQVHQGGLT